MHDMMNQPLKVGDTVLIPAKIVELQPFENLCNVSVETLHGRRPDGMKEKIWAINTGVMLKVGSADSPASQS